MYVCMYVSFYRFVDHGKKYLFTKFERNLKKSDFQENVPMGTQY